MSTPVLALFSGADECTPDVKTVQPQLLAAWMKAAPEGVLEGEIIPGASHNVKEEELSKILIERVLKFINA
jgi:alpha-beta hydrolase superfamily lysophospholipase